MTEGWNYATLWEQIARLDPDRPAIVHGDDIWSWSRFDAAANALAQTLLDLGLTRQSKVGLHLPNVPEFVVALAAALKVGLVPFNVNYRYGSTELMYLFENADAEAIVFGAGYADRLEPLRSKLPLVKAWIAVDAVGEIQPTWSLAFASLVAPGVAESVRAPWGRSDNDVVMLYTGGTTGMPKGVMWPQSDCLPWDIYDLEESPATSAKTPDNTAALQMSGTRPSIYVACPMMHGTGMFAATQALSRAGTVILPSFLRFDAERIWDEIEATGATELSVVGMAFCLPLLEALDRNPGRWALDCLRVIGSSGAMWSEDNKAGLIRHIAHVTLVDSFSSSETVGIGTAISTAESGHRTAQFVTGPTCAVFTEDHRRVTPGSGERGLVAVSGAVPLGYYKDEEKSRTAFPVIEGQRWSMPGDWAEVNADGTLKLLGRGSQCINTGGEKVFPEEVEEVLKRYPGVRDAAVVGVPDARFGERVCALIERQPGFDEASEGALAEHVHTRLADHKVPRVVLVVESIQRTPSGKLDYPALRATAMRQIAGLEAAIVSNSDAAQSHAAPEGKRAS